MTTNQPPIAIHPESELALALRCAVEIGEPVRLAAGDVVFEVNVMVRASSAATLAVTDEPAHREIGGIEQAAGGWQGLIDFDAFIEDLYESRRRAGRPPVTLD